MQRESNWRYYFIIVVLFVCLFLIFDTAQYVRFVFRSQPPEPTAFENRENFEQANEEYETQLRTLQRNAIKFGLDLIGGVDVLLKIDTNKMQQKLLSNLRQDMRRELQEKRIGASITITENGDRMTLKLDDRANGRQAANALSDYFDGASSRAEGFDAEKLIASGSNTFTLNEGYLRRELTTSIRNAEKSIRERVDRFGVTQPSVSLQESGGMVNGIRVQVPGERDPEALIREVIRPAQLEFYLVHEKQITDGGYDPNFANQFYEKKEVEGPYGEMRTEFVLKSGAQLPPGFIGLEGEELDRRVSPPVTIRRMYIVKKDPLMTGQHLRDAYVQTNPASMTNAITVGLTFNPQGAAKFRQVTRDNLKRHLAIALDKKIYSAPRINSVIPNGQAVIEGNFQSDDARDLALVLKAGALPADLRPDETRAVGPTLGEESIEKSLTALGITALVIACFMLVYYGPAAGFVSILALFLNLLVIVACLDLFNATLTLSGIGGMILTLGMAVDANVLIYERIREEIANGKALQAAIRGGFGRAFSVIFDSNLTTLLAAFVLLQFGEGSVQGFALTMAFGLLANLFTGLTVTYALCMLWFRWRGKISFGFVHILQNPKINFIGMRYASFTLSAIVVLACIGVLIARGGPQMAVDFQGGVLSEVRVDGADEDMTEEFMQALPGGQAKVQKVAGSDYNDYLVRLALQKNPENPAGSGDPRYTEIQIRETLNTLAESKDDVNIQILGTTSVSQEVGQQFQQIALFVVISASLCILIYLWFRFELVFGMAAVVALIHDLTITLGLITLLDIQISLDIVSALLILLGFSVNDTIVIFDRIRENSHSMFGHPFKDICNRAMNKTLSRTLITSLTTVGAMLIMFFFGGHSLAPFAMTLIIGGLVGTYSSDFVATPLVYLWNEHQEGRLVEHLGRKNAGPVDVEPVGEPAPAAAGGATSDAQPRRRGRR